MKKIYISILVLFSISVIHAQDFQGALTYGTKTNIHIQKEQEQSFKYKSPNRKDKDSIHRVINDSTLYNHLKRKGKIVDSIQVIFGNSKIRKTYYQNEKIEYIFDLASVKKITHTPKYECIDTTSFKLVDYKDEVQIIESDSIFSINGHACKKIKVIKSNFYFIELYFVESEFKNLADAFIFDINNNLLFQNLYFLRKNLEFKKIIKLKYYSKPNAIEFEYILKSMIKRPYTENDFSLPKYEYCFWDILDDKKLMRTHKKRMKLEKERLKREKNE